MVSAPSIRAVIVSLGAASVLIALGLAGFGLIGVQQQLDARQRVVVLESALKNHDSADAFMDSVRTDVLRALQNAIGANHEGGAAIQTDLTHHIDVFTTALHDNELLPMNPALHRSYEQIGTLLPSFVAASHKAVDLALTDSTAGSANFEVFRHNFTQLESLMDEVRNIVHDRVQDVRVRAADTARLGRWMILGSLAGGVLLLLVITGVAVRIAHRITSALAASREQAQFMALHDNLTGLANRGLFADRLRQDLACIEREKAGLAVVCLDLDRFKHVNDTLGHPVGDLLLRAVSDRLRSCVRQSDTVARLGGDEFAVIFFPLAGSDEARCTAIGGFAERAIRILSEPYDLGEHRIVIGASIGIAAAPNDASQADSLLKMADMALYRAKADGRGIARFFEPKMDQEVQERRSLETDLRRAIEQNEFVLHYQPLVDVRSGCVRAMEALIRWQHPEQGLLEPDAFIPVAEKIGLMTEIGRFVVLEACRQAVRWPASIKVAVNLSASEFKSASLTQTITHSLQQSGLTPNRLELEVTETAFLKESDATLDTLKALRSLGVLLVLDNFGTDYSSFTFLRRFMFDKIKLDRSFIQDLADRPDGEAIFRAMIGIGTSLGIVTVAQGVERPAQLSQVQEHGCDQVQGYLIGTPVLAQHVPALLARDPALYRTLSRVRLDNAEVSQAAAPAQPIMLSVSEPAHAA